MLRLRYQTGVLDADCAARIASYHLTVLAHFTVLALIAVDPDAERGRQSQPGCERTAAGGIVAWKVVSGQRDAVMAVARWVKRRSVVTPVSMWFMT